MENAQSNLVVKVHRSDEELDQLRAFWVQNQAHPNSDPDHFLLVCRLLPEVTGHCVFSVWQGDVCKCLVAGRIAHLAVQPALGYFKLPSVRVRTMTVIYAGVIGRLDRPAADALVKSVNQLVAGQIVDLATFSGLQEGSALIEAVRCGGRGTLGAARPRWVEHWEMRMGAQPGFLVRSMRSKHRSWVNKKTVEFEKAFAGRFVWRWLAQIDEVASLCQRMERVASRTYQRGLDAGFKDDAVHRERLSLFARQGTLRVLLLEVNSEPVAFWYGVTCQGVFHSEATGYVPELQDYEVGTQLFLRLVDELVAEGMSRFDFGLGDAHYKKRFGDHSWKEANVQLFGCNWKGLLLRAYVGSCGAIDVALRSVIARLGFADRIKQVWRRKLAGRVTKSASLS